MQQLLQLFILIPLAAFLISLVLPRKRESLISGAAIISSGIQSVGLLAFITAWLLQGFPVLDIKHVVFFKSDDIEIFIDFYFDRSTAVFGVIGSILVFLVSVFSRYYMHRDAGFKRFFCTLLFFYTGYNFIVFAGNFETLFLGWEILGISSFLLIAFYRDRYLPAKNALKVISIYRLGDICLILAMWMSHHLWHENITFIKFSDTALLQSHLSTNGWYPAFLAGMIVMAATAKSAQLPFSSWLPRAMEGPTTSSAIFYGSLSVHLGAFLLLRTYPYWEHLVLIKYVVIAIGISTTVITTLTARVQSTVKTQIAYSSVAQIGIIFIEIALGFHTLALIHFAGNAFLRTYQLLVSPSVLSYLIHDMVFSYKPAVEKNKSGIADKIRNTLYILSVREWNLDQVLHRYLWSPFKWLGKKSGFLARPALMIMIAIIFIFGTYTLFSSQQHPYLPHLLSAIGLLLVLKSFSDRGDAIKAGSFVVAGQLFITLSIALLNKSFDLFQVVIYLGGVIAASITAFICLREIKKRENGISLNQFNGYTYGNTTVALVFLIACLALIGLPFTPTFIGIDLLFSHIGKEQGYLITLTSISFIFIELAVLRIYARVFLGQQMKGDHPVAFRYS